MSEDKPVVHSHAEWSLPNDEGDRQLAVWFDDDTGFEPGDAVTALLTSEYKARAAENVRLRQQLEEAPSRQVLDAHVRMLAETRARLQTVEGERDKHLAEAVDVHVRLQAAQREVGSLRARLQTLEEREVAARRENIALVDRCATMVEETAEDCWRDNADVFAALLNVAADIRQNARAAENAQLRQQLENERQRAEGFRLGMDSTAKAAQERIQTLEGERDAALDSLTEQASMSIKVLAQLSELRAALSAPASPAATVQGEECDCAKTLPPGHHRCSRPSGEVVWRKGVPPTPPTGAREALACRKIPGPNCGERECSLGCNWSGGR